MAPLPFTRGQFPTRLAAIFCEDITGAPLPELPVFSHAIVGVTPEAGGNTQVLDVALGTLASDHAGYLSYDLAPLERRLDDLVEGGLALGKPVAIEVRNLWLHPYGPIPQSIDALDVQNVVDDAIVVRLSVGRQSVFLGNALGFAAIQNPSLTDWYLSPGSFSHLPAEIIGQDGCETMLPSNVATQHFTFAQAVPLSGTIPARWVDPAKAAQDIERATEIVFGGAAVAGAIAKIVAAQSFQFNPNLPANWPGPRTAISIDYDVTWTPVGHGLGQILYSLPLAPAEQVNIAIIDWSRTSTDRRTEDTAFSEELQHDTKRDRTVGEVVQATLHEWQRGGSFMGGEAVSAGAPGIIGGALSLGGSYATTSGDRELTGNTVQHVVDLLSQATTSMRDLRSTVVVQSTQSGTQNLQTRTVRNYNHSHALTLLYYEVLRHYRVVVERGDIRPALLIDQNMPDIDEIGLFTYRRFLEPALLAPALKPGFDAAEKLFALERDPVKPDPPAAGDLPFTLFRFIFHTGGMTNPSDVTCTIKNAAFANDVPVVGIDGAVTLGARDQFNRNDYTLELEGVPNGGSIKWSNVGFFVFTVTPFADSSGGPHLGLTQIRVKGVDITGVEHDLGAWTGDKLYGSKEIFPAIAAVRPPGPPPKVTPLDVLSDDERHARSRLIAHINSNKAYYYRQIWLGEDPNARAIRFDTVTLTFDGASHKLLDIVENRVIDVIANKLVMPLDPGLLDERGQENPFARAALQIDLLAHARSEKLLSLPTRGVFGEAKLGHCNSSEVIDNSRFWDWQKSPVPDSAPAITGIQPVATTAPPTLVPTGFPTPIATIQAAVQEPDPAGLKAALDLLKTPGIFNDLSGLNQVRDLLKSLGDAAAKASGKTDTADASKPKDGTTPPGGAPAKGDPAKGDPAAGAAKPAAPADAGGGNAQPAKPPAAPAPAAPLPAQPKAQGPKSKSFLFSFWGNDLEGDMSGTFTVTGATVPAAGQQILAGPGAPLVNGTLIGSGDLDGPLSISVSGKQSFGPNGRTLPITGAGDHPAFVIFGVDLKGSLNVTPPAGPAQLAITVKKEVIYKGEIAVTRAAGEDVLPQLGKILGVPITSFILVNRTSADPAAPGAKVNELWEVYYATGNLVMSA